MKNYESRLFEAIKRGLAARCPGALAVKNHGNPYQPVGRPDIEVLIPARCSASGRDECWWIELKRPGRSPSPAQARWLRLAAAAGGRTGTVRDLAGFWALLGFPA